MDSPHKDMITTLENWKRGSAIELVNLKTKVRHLTVTNEERRDTVALLEDEKYEHFICFLSNSVCLILLQRYKKAFTHLSERPCFNVPECCSNVRDRESTAYTQLLFPLKKRCFPLLMPPPVHYTVFRHSSMINNHIESYVSAVIYLFW